MKQIVVAFIVLIGLVAAYVLLSMVKPFAPEGVACTLDAKMCPDGTYVGRVAPDCEFAACPESSQE